jgi:hypothetical protein
MTDIQKELVAKWQNLTNLNLIPTIKQSDARTDYKMVG